MSDSDLLAGRLALVTGGSRGLGRATVRAFAQAGADVVIVSRRREACEALAAEVHAATGRRAVPMPCHVGRWVQLEPLVERVYSEVGDLDILVNNAGMSPVYDTLSEVTEELWRKVIDVNLTGPFRLSALIGERMAAGRGGSIINVSSVASEYPLPATVPYAAAKAGLDAMTIGMARAFGPKVRVNAVLPGTFLTDISRHWDMQRFELERRSFALGRSGEPDEITGAMLYLASDQSSYTTGATLRVDGGYVPVIHPAS
jgi:NAD(P)-dependent dehydrogenase (short-subunit alcohol dehydrogenase family)